MLNYAQGRLKKPGKQRNAMDYTIQTMPHEIAAPLIERYRKLDTPIDVVYGTDSVTIMIHNGLLPIRHTPGSLRHNRLRN